MPLSEQFEKTGAWLFQWRSYLPLLLIGLFFLAFLEIGYPYGHHWWDLPWEMLCLLVSLAGLGIRMLTVGQVPFGTSGRNTKNQVARVLNTAGMYSVVRNPLYLGNFIIWLGVSLFLRRWWFTLLITLIFWLYYERIVYAEESFLRKKFGEQFTQWASNTPAFLPDLRKWRKSALPFSWKVALRKEYSTFFAIITTFTVIKFVGLIITHKTLMIDWVWAGIFLVGLFIYIPMRILKKYTQVLNVAGR
ncbi:MAG: hypothetical protein FJ134_15685 [Deltaproteobacteria bacterium]|nr:hypothetical protein [Deltaproteobacteria bacterium]